jgi:predicted phosphodiesterase
VLAHPRRAQPAIRMAGESVDVMWLAPGIAPAGAAITIDGAAVGAPLATCDADGICSTTIVVPAIAPGLHALCVALPANPLAHATKPGQTTTQACSNGAIAVVDAYHDPVTIVHVSDAHVGDGDNLNTFRRVITAINELAPDVVVFTGDGADHGQPDQRADFVEQIERLTVPVYIVTGNHDYDDVGLDGHLIDVSPELDFAAQYGGLRMLGVSSGQDLDNGHHVGTISISSGPDASQLDWLALQLVTEQPTVVFLHHPIYNGLFATVGPARDRIKSMVTRPFVHAVLAGHTHVRSVFDADGNSRGLSLDGESDVSRKRWPLHYTAARATRGSGGFAVFHVSADHLDYQWHGL